MKLIEQYEQVLREYHAADRRFQESTQEYVDAAIYALMEKEKLLSILLEQIKKEPRMAPVDSNLTKYLRKYFNMMGGKKQ